jgi:outer membrane murein-binding lipoprotein Lpp
MIVFAVVAVALVAAGAYLEHKFGSKVVARVTALEARVAAVEGDAKAAVAAKFSATVGAADAVVKKL